MFKPNIVKSFFNNVLQLTKQNLAATFKDFKDKGAKDDYPWDVLSEEKKTTEPGSFPEELFQSVRQFSLLNHLTADYLEALHGSP